MSIPCPGTKTLTSTKTETCYGIFKDSNYRCAKSRAEKAVLEDLKQQFNDAECDDDCMKRKIRESQMQTTVKCERLWWTLFIAVKCKATAEQELEIECYISG